MPTTNTDIYRKLSEILDELEASRRTVAVIGGRSTTRLDMTPVVSELQTITGHVDGLEANTDTLEALLADLKTLLTSSNANTAQYDGGGGDKTIANWLAIVDGRVDGLEAMTNTGNIHLADIDSQTLDTSNRLLSAGAKSAADILQDIDDNTDGIEGKLDLLLVQVTISAVQIVLQVAEAVITNLKLTDIVTNTGNIDTKLGTIDTVLDNILVDVDTTRDFQQSWWPIGDDGNILVSKLILDSATTAASVAAATAGIYRVEAVEIENTDSSSRNVSFSLTYDDGVTNENVQIGTVSAGATSTTPWSSFGSDMIAMLKHLTIDENTSFRVNSSGITAGKEVRTRVIFTRIRGSYD